MIEALQFSAVSATVNVVSPIAQTLAIPVNSAGTNPRWCMISCDVRAKFLPIQTGANPSISEMCFLSPENPLVIFTGGFDAIRIHCPAGTSIFTVSPLDNQ